MLDKYPTNDRYEATSPTPLTWSGILGPVCRKAELPPELQADKGLVAMTTKQGTQVCPVKQFVTGDDGRQKLIPEVSTGWVLLTSLEKQVGFSDSSCVLRFMGPHQDATPSFFDALADPALPESDKQAVLLRIAKDAVEGAGWAGMELQDPRRIL